MRFFGHALMVGAALALSACGKPTKTEQSGGTRAESSVAGQGGDPDSLARATLAAQNLPDPEGKLALALAEAVRALPEWAPFYPGARLGLDSGAEGESVVQVGFTTTDSEEKVAAFYMNAMRVKGNPTDLPEDGVRSIEVASPDQSEITSVILSPAEGGGVSGIIRYERPS